MKMKWAAVAAVSAVTAMAAVPAVAQNNMTTMTSSGMMNYTNVDESEVRGNLDQLRDYLTRMQENARLQFAAGDIVQADGYRRANVILLDNAMALALHTSKELGPPTSIPPGWGLARDYVADVVGHLSHARLMADYSLPIDEASTALNKAQDALRQSSMGMSGTNMNQ